MIILFLDIDSLRPDHLGCYGYHRNTSPNIDKIAEKATRFTNYYTSDAPCLPSRTALTTGKFGIRSGLVNHGGEASRLRLSEQDLDFKDGLELYSLAGLCRQKGMETILVSPFAERHSAWHFNAGWNTVVNTGKQGGEIAEEITPVAIDWLQRNEGKDNWCLYLNYWDPHTPYRTPIEFGDPFKDDPIPEWLTEEKLNQDRKLAGPHTAQEIDLYSNTPMPEYPRHASELKNMDDMRMMIDGYDTGVRYMDTHVGIIMDELKRQGIEDEVMIILTADHAENLGELGIYAEHATADKGTCNIPMIISLPGENKGHVDEDLHYHLDLLPTMADILDASPGPEWDGQSYSSVLTKQESAARDYLVFSQCAHVCQRSVRFDDWLYIRTYHDGFHLFDEHMLFNVKEDPYEEHDLAEDREDIVKEATYLLNKWRDEMLGKMNDPVDPLWTVMKEGGPHHANGHLKDYIENRLIPTGRTDVAEQLKEKHPSEFE